MLPLVKGLTLRRWHKVNLRRKKIFKRVRKHARAIKIKAFCNRLYKVIAKKLNVSIGGKQLFVRNRLSRGSNKKRRSVWEKAMWRILFLLRKRFRGVKQIVKVPEVGVKPKGLLGVDRKTFMDRLRGKYSRRGYHDLGESRKYAYKGLSQGNNKTKVFFNRSTGFRGRLAAKLSKRVSPNVSIRLYSDFKYRSKKKPGFGKSYLLNILWKRSLYRRYNLSMCMLSRKLSLGMLKRLESGPKLPCVSLYYKRKVWYDRFDPRMLNMWKRKRTRIKIINTFLF